MVENQNQEVLNRISEDIKEPNVATLPRNIVNSIQPVLISNPKEGKHFLKGHASRSTTGSSTVLTTPSDKDFYLTGLILAYSCDATADSTSYILALTIDGGATGQNFIQLQKQTLTAFSDHLAFTPQTPIRLARGSTIVINQTFSAGTSTITGTAIGYSVDTLVK